MERKYQEEEDRTSPQAQKDELADRMAIYHDHRQQPAFVQSSVQSGLAVWGTQLQSTDRSYRGSRTQWYDASLTRSGTFEATLENSKWIAYIELLSPFDQTERSRERRG